jgi:hypothetical protein
VVITTNATTTTFTFPNFQPTATAAFTLSLKPTVAGSFTFNVNAAASGVQPSTTNFTANVAASVVDVGVQVTNVPAAVLIQDAVTYKVVVTNAGPSDATPSVKLQTTFDNPGNILSVTPAPVGGYTFANKVLGFEVGPLTNLASKTYFITVQPTNAGAFSLSTTITTPVGQNSETVTNNNTVTNLISVLNVDSAGLQIISQSTPIFNFQTGLMDQFVQVKNTTTSSIPSVRIFATNLVAPNRLYNATGTNFGQPYVASPGALPANETITFQLHYFFQNRSSNTVVQLSLVKAPAPSVAAAAGAVVTRIGQTFQLDFPTTPGKRYVVLYTTSNTLNFAQSQPFITATNSRTQFIDDGPPKTDSAPTNTSARIYNVIELP